MDILDFAGSTGLVDKEEGERVKKKSPDWLKKLCKIFFIIFGRTINKINPGFYSLRGNFKGFFIRTTLNVFCLGEIHQTTDFHFL